MSVLPVLESDDHHQCLCSQCQRKTSELEKLHADLTLSQHKFFELKSYIQTRDDLNAITQYITRYYTDIYREVKREFKTSVIGNNTIPSFTFNSWVELFSAASSECKHFDDFDIDKKPINNAIASAMDRLGGLTLEHWGALQDVRKDRNNNGHPPLNDSNVLRALRDRWSGHSAFDALSKMMNHIKHTRNRAKGRRKMLQRSYNKRNSWRG